jgi:hypothetical protein
MSIQQARLQMWSSWQAHLDATHELVTIDSFPWAIAQFTIRRCTIANSTKIFELRSDLWNLPVQLTKNLQCTLNCIPCFWHHGHLQYTELVNGGQVRASFVPYQNTLSLTLTMMNLVCQSHNSRLR